MNRWIACAFFLFILGMMLLNCGTGNPRILIQTELGDIEVEIEIDRAPLTAANFLAYVEANAFEEGSFYRTVTMQNQPDDEIKIEVIQGGISERDRMLPPIEHETTDRTGILHRSGVISMARNEPGSATSEFFICVGDQPELDFGGKRNPDGQGFAAFGRVIEGMDVVHSIHQRPVNGQRLDPPVRIVRIREMVNR